MRTPTRRGLRPHTPSPPGVLAHARSGRLRRRRIAPLALALLAVACSDDDDTGTTSAAAATSPSVAATTTSTTSLPATTAAATEQTTVPASVVDDTQEVGATALYAVDLATGAAEPLGPVGTEIGVLGLTLADDGALIGLTDVPEVITFTTDDPATLIASVPVTGSEGATLLALDRRADDGVLIAVGATGSLMTVDPVTGVAAGINGTSVPVADPGIGLDVDPESGEVIMTDAAGAHRSVDTASGTVTDAPPLAFVEGDPNAGSTPRVVAVAVASDGTRFAIDAGTASLAVLGHDGGLITIGPLGIDVTDGASFDIAVDGQAYLTSPG